MRGGGSQKFVSHGIFKMNNFRANELSDLVPRSLRLEGSARDRCGAWACLATDALHNYCASYNASSHRRTLFMISTTYGVSTYLILHGSRRWERAELTQLRNWGWSEWSRAGGTPCMIDVVPALQHPLAPEQGESQHQFISSSAPIIQPSKVGLGTLSLSSTSYQVSRTSLVTKHNTSSFLRGVVIANLTSIDSAEIQKATLVYSGLEISLRWFHEVFRCVAE